MVYGTVQSCYFELCSRSEILTTDNDSNVKSLQKEKRTLRVYTRRYSYYTRVSETGSLYIKYSRKNNL